MFTRSSIKGPFGRLAKRSNICPAGGEAQVFKWDSVGDGRNIVLTSSSHEECYEKYWKNIQEFDYEVTIKENKLEEAA